MQFFVYLNFLTCISRFIIVRIDGSSSRFQRVFLLPKDLTLSTERKESRQEGRKVVWDHVTEQVGGAKFPYLASLGGVNRHNWGLSSSLTQTAVRLLSSPLFFRSFLGFWFVQRMQRMSFILFHRRRLATFANEIKRRIYHPFVLITRYFKFS